MVGSAVFLVVLSILAASIRITVAGSEAAEAARAAAVHAARHDDVDSARSVAERLFPDHGVTARVVGNHVEVTVSFVTPVAHPVAPVRVRVSAAARMPMAPFRSAHG